MPIYISAKCSGFIFICPCCCMNVSNLDALELNRQLLVDLNDAGTGGSGRVLRWKVILLVFNMHFWIAILTVFCRDGNDLQTTKEYGVIINKTNLKNTGRCRKAANHFNHGGKRYEHTKPKMSLPN